MCFAMQFFRHAIRTLHCSLHDFHTTATAIEKLHAATHLTTELFTAMHFQISRHVLCVTRNLTVREIHVIIYIHCTSQNALPECASRHDKCSHKCPRDTITSRITSDIKTEKSNACSAPIGGMFSAMHFHGGCGHVLRTCTLHKLPRVLR